MKKHTKLSMAIITILLILAGCAAPAAPVMTQQTTSSAPPPTTQTSHSTVQTTVLPPPPPPEPKVLEFTDASLLLTEKGQSHQIYCGNVELEQITWATSDRFVATVHAGLITFVGEGSATITATYEDQLIRCEVTCKLSEYPADLNAPRLDPPVVSDEVCHFFDDAAFIGDSISLMLSYQQANCGELGDALFLVKGSYGVNNAITGTLKISYQGVSMYPEDALAKAGVKKVFIMLGTNDVGWCDLDYLMQQWGVLIQRIRNKNPELEIYIQSCLPIWTNGQIGKLNNDRMDDYNQRLFRFCEENGCYFVNIAPYFKDYTNGLASRYCSDKYVHLTYEAAQVWIHALKEYVGMLGY